MIFPSPAGMSLTKLSLAGNNLNLVSDIPAGDGKTANLFLTVRPTGGLSFGGISDDVEKVVVVPSLDIAPPHSLLSANKCKPHRGKKE